MLKAKKIKKPKKISRCCWSRVLMKFAGRTHYYICVGCNNPCDVTTRKELKKELKDLSRQIVRLRDDDTCQICGKKVYGSNSQPCHVYPKGKYRRLEFDLINLFLGCMHCHFHFWHAHPIKAYEWFTEKFPSRMIYLAAKSNLVKGSIKDSELIEWKEQLEQKLKELQNDT